MIARTRTADDVTVIFEPVGEPTVRIVAPRAKALLRSLVLLLAHGKLNPGDRLTVIDGDEADDLPVVNRGSHYGG